MQPYFPRGNKGKYPGAPRSYNPQHNYSRTCSNGTLRASSFIKSLALNMEYGSNVFLVVLTVILPSIRSNLALTNCKRINDGMISYYPIQPHNLRLVSIKTTYYFSEGFLYKGPTLFQVCFSVLWK